MRRSRWGRWAGGLVLLSAAVSHAEGVKPAAPAVSSDAGGGAATPSEGAARALRRDPDGVRGISPSREALARGDRAVVARDLDAAQREYQAAIVLAPSEPLGHLRVAELALLRRDFAVAEDALAAAGRYGVGDPKIEARVAFSIALLREAQRDLPRAAEAWARYASLAGVELAPPPSAAQVGESPSPAPAIPSGGSTPSATPPSSVTPPSSRTAAATSGSTAAPHATTAQARHVTLESRQRQEREYAKVRERIQAELGAAERARQESAKK